MKVSFLKPPIGGILGLEMLTFVEPLGLECVAGALEPDGHDCQIVDLRIDGEAAGLAKFRAFEPEVVGLQCNFTTERNRTLRLARKVRQETPEAFIVVGGHDASRDPAWFEQPEFDAIAIGDGEDVMPALVDTLDRGDDLRKVPGLALKRDGELVLTGHAPTRSNLDELPMPARHLIDEYADHYYINFRKPLALMETARGCPFKCNFCSVWKFHESTFREKSPERVNKSNTAAKNERAIEILKELGVGFTCNFIVDPAWDHEDFARLREWIDRMGAYNSGFSVLTPLPGTDLWDEAKRHVNTEQWELFDIVHTVLPTKLPIEEFYAEYSRLWDWALQVRYKHRGKLKTYAQLAGALAARKVTMQAVRKGMNIAKVFSDPETFLSGHREAGQLGPASA